jgi:hypothetical protein
VQVCKLKGYYYSNGHYPPLVNDKKARKEARKEARKVARKEKEKEAEAEAKAEAEAEAEAAAKAEAEAEAAAAAEAEGPELETGKQAQLDTIDVSDSESELETGKQAQLDTIDVSDSESDLGELAAKTKALEALVAETAKLQTQLEEARLAAKQRAQKRARAQQTEIQAAQPPKKQQKTGDVPVPAVVEPKKPDDVEGVAATQRATQAARKRAQETGPPPTKERSMTGPAVLKLDDVVAVRSNEGVKYGLFRGNYGDDKVQVRYYKKGKTGPIDSNMRRVLRSALMSSLDKE